MDIKTVDNFLDENDLTGKLHCRNRELMEYDRCDFRDVLVEFAQYHVQKALLQASEKVQIKIRKGFIGKTPTMWDIDINKDSILNAYDLNEIK